MNNWVDKEIEQLEEDYENGYLTDRELNEAISDVYAELEMQAEEAAECARQDVLGY